MCCSEKKKTIILKWLIYISGIVCLYAFIAVRSQFVFNLGVNEKLISGYWDITKYGELYYFNYIKHFKEKNLPQLGEKLQFSDKQASLADADILLFGDSFFDMSRPTQFPLEIALRLNKKVHFANVHFPLEYLSQHHYQGKTPKILILESAERYVPVRFAKQHTTQYTIDERSKVRIFLSDIKDKIFYSRSEEFYDALLKRSYLTSEIYSIIATAKFDLFGYIPKLTPVYSLKDTVPWLFYHEEVNDKITSFYYKHTDEDIERISNNVLDLSRQLKEKFNIELIYLPVPGKYTICHTWINNDEYNNLLPRLYKKFDEKHINYINFYDTFKESKDILYIPTDGHWNEEGLEMAVQLTLDYLNKNNLIH